MSRSAKIDNAACSDVSGGALNLRSIHSDEPVDNGFGREVDYLTSAWRTPRRGEPGHSFSFTENMRIEVRARRTNTVGMNDALWFMGDNDRGWPACGEIDLLENPKKEVNHTAHFTLHSEHRYANVMGGKGGITATADLSDMTQWNIYWVEILPDRIEGGVNGETYFIHRRPASVPTDLSAGGGDSDGIVEGGVDGVGNGIEGEDWPWSDPNGFYMIISTGLSDDPRRWPGAVDPSEWDPSAPPTFSVDWVRVYVNDDFVPVSSLTE